MDKQMCRNKGKTSDWEMEKQSKPNKQLVGNR